MWPLFSIIKPRSLLRGWTLNTAKGRAVSPYAFPSLSESPCYPSSLVVITCSSVPSEPHLQAFLTQRQWQATARLPDLWMLLPLYVYACFVPSIDGTLNKFQPKINNQNSDFHSKYSFLPPLSLGSFNGISIYSL